MKRTRTEIIIQQEDLLIMSPANSSMAQLRWCALCRAEVEMVAPELAAALAGAEPRGIYRLIESNQLHFSETSGGQVLVCVNSLREVITMRDHVSTPAEVCLVIED